MRRGRAGVEGRFLGGGRREVGARTRVRPRSTIASLKSAPAPLVVGGNVVQSRRRSRLENGPTETRRPDETTRNPFWRMEGSWRCACSDLEFEAPESARIALEPFSDFRAILAIEPKLGPTRTRLPPPPPPPPGTSCLFSINDGLMSYNGGPCARSGHGVGGDQRNGRRQKITHALGGIMDAPPRLF
jgi:hypothetical protein